MLNSVTCQVDWNTQPWFLDSKIFITHPGTCMLNHKDNLSSPQLPGLGTGHEEWQFLWEMLKFSCHFLMKYSTGIHKNLFRLQSYERIYSSSSCQVNTCFVGRTNFLQLTTPLFSMMLLSHFFWIQNQFIFLNQDWFSDSCLLYKLCVSFCDIKKLYCLEGSL